MNGFLDDFQERSLEVNPGKSEFFRLKFLNEALFVDLSVGNSEIFDMFEASMEGWRRDNVRWIIFVEL